MSDLGHVLWLLHGARERYSTLRIDVDVAVDADHLHDMDSGGESYGIRRSTVTMWIDPPWRWRLRWRGWDQPFEAGRDGWRAWTTERNRGYRVGIGGHTHVQSPIVEPQPLEELWDPALPISELWLEPEDERVEVAGRVGRFVTGLPRPTPRPDGRDFLLLDWPKGERYEFVVDEEFGIVLRVRTFRREWEIVREEITSLEVDRPIDATVFRGDAEP
jgi:hypothetical protein